MVFMFTCHNDLSPIIHRPMPKIYPHKPLKSSQDLHIEHLAIQRDHLLLIRDRHLQWMGESDDLTVRTKHFEIAASIEKIASQYDSLIHLLQEIR